MSCAGWAPSISSIWARASSGGCGITVATAQADLAAAAAGGGLYAQGLFVSLSNPKVILFLGAFLPQFVDAGADPVDQLVVLAALFVLVLAAVDVATTLAVAEVRSTLAAERVRLLDGASGALLMLGGLALAAMRRP